MKLLNLGCGYRFHPDWMNVDFTATGENVLAHNLTLGVPFPDNHFNAVYHSHVLEHFSREGGARFMAECFRVTRPGGIIRVAVPDLERIAREYLQQLDQVLAGNGQPTTIGSCSKWTTRPCATGAAAKCYLFLDQVEYLDFVYGRLGHEAWHLREEYLRKQKKPPAGNAVRKPAGWLQKFFSVPYYKKRLKRLLFADEGQYLEVGKFRMGGEIHQWMYDRYSLGRLLLESGFRQPRQQTAFQSLIPGWNSYCLDASDGVVQKPDLLFMEAIKP